MGGKPPAVLSPSAISIMTREPSGRSRSFLTPRAMASPRAVPWPAMLGTTPSSNWRTAKRSRVSGESTKAWLPKMVSPMRSPSRDSMKRSMTPLTTCMRVTCWPSTVKSRASMEWEASTASIRS